MIMIIIIDNITIIDLILNIMFISIVRHLYYYCNYYYYHFLNHVPQGFVYEISFGENLRRITSLKLSRIVYFQIFFSNRQSQPLPRVSYYSQILNPGMLYTIVSDSQYEDKQRKRKSQSTWWRKYCSICSR